MEMGDFVNHKALPDVHLGMNLEDSLEMQALFPNLFVDGSKDVQVQQPGFYITHPQNACKEQLIYDQRDGAASSVPLHGLQLSGGEKRYVLEENRLVTVSTFRSKKTVHIRDFYKDGQDVLRPSKKGIVLTLGQWEKLKTMIPAIDEALNTPDSQ